MRVHVVTHVAFEGPALIAQWASERGHAVAQTEVYRAQPLPETGQVDFLVLMGGPMSVGDEVRHPWLKAEKRFIGQCLEADRPVLGVCLGAQLIADVLGARVYRCRHKEIGWFPVRKTADAVASQVFAPLPASFPAFHWHGETFDIPRGARRLARSGACANQAFAWRRALALQFHLEVTRGSVAELARHCAADIQPGPWQQSAAEFLAPSAPFAALKPLLYGVLDRVALQGQLADVAARPRAADADARARARLEQ